MPAAMLTTGKAAKLCSVQPDTVLKWIKKGRLAASRTAGGHYRVSERDLLLFLDRNSAPEASLAESRTLCSRPMRCWEYMNHGPGGQCRDCVVYKVRATYCFSLVDVVKGMGHAKLFCSGPCEDCPYYRRVHGLPTNVLVITTDEDLIRALSQRRNEAIEFLFARRADDVPAITTVFRPAFVILDEAILENLGVEWLDSLATGAGTMGARVVLGVRKGQVRRRFRHVSFFATVEEPFSADEIVAITSRLPIEMLPSEEAAAT